ncbi:16S rRNA (uracil(1498)-N(3))-methyltransferase [Sulfuriferula nivalis]|uniref:Ribosomal RNA small subunit methyltransferase E n=1 Tax=Sulfuriferula nivalis TaxID=2675298 RepID=A0A809RLI7_9PROT|nr:16S rRNA (uracil(1498)-N(3))-methyltransferase [Sulfuriferula nivalis]BBP02426.1 ribosomal RNA small subunit methyltransferase E [Sulfuriferula nivalis]
MSRFYFPDTIQTHQDYALPDAAAHHAARVLRLNVGDHITLFNGTGEEYAASITFIDKRNVNVHIESCQNTSRESPLKTTLVQGISSGDRMDYTLQKAVELGVTHIQPVSCARSVVKLNDERADKRRIHWQNLVISACEQCGRNTVPQVAPVMSLNAWLNLPSTSQLRLLFAPDAEHTLHTLAAPTGPIELLAGPEGGFTPDEYQAALATQHTAIRLGPRVLRTETAALAALSAMQTLWGDF